PTFFVRGKRAFLMVLRNHHGDGRFAIWCAAPPGLQAMLVEADPERFFVPPYVGHRGWLGMRLDRALDWDELAGIVEDAYAEVAPPKLVAQARCSARRCAASIFAAVAASFDHTGQEYVVALSRAQPDVQPRITFAAVVLKRPASPRILRTALAPRMRRTTSSTSQSSIPSRICSRRALAIGWLRPG